MHSTARFASSLSCTFIVTISLIASAKVNWVRHESQPIVETGIIITTSQGFPSRACFYIVVFGFGRYYIIFV